MLQHLTALCEAVELPMNADFESGFASDPEGVAANVGLAVQAGVAGLSIEDRDIEAPFGLYDRAFAVERIRAARAAIDRSGEDVILVARAARGAAIAAAEQIRAGAFDGLAGATSGKRLNDVFAGFV